MNLLSVIPRKGLAVAFMLLPSLYVSAQADSPLRKVEHSLLVGIGAADVLDTYLAPFSYTGTNARLQFDTSRPVALRKDSLSRNTLLDVNAAMLDNHAGNIDAYAFGIRYSMNWLRPLHSINSFSVAVGPEVSAYLGAVYVDRSGNNPANAHADMTINAAAHAAYAFTAWHRVWKVRGQLAIPLIGAAFSPNYGQSYYEAFELGNYDHNVVFAHVFNMPSLRYRLTLDIPVGKHESTFRIGYAGQMNQSVFHDLKYHSYTHDFMIGYSKTLYKR